MQKLRRAKDGASGVPAVRKEVNSRKLKVESIKKREAADVDLR